MLTTRQLGKVSVLNSPRFMTCIVKKSLDNYIIFLIICCCCRYPDSFKKFWEVKTKVFVTPNINKDISSFSFDQSKATEVAYVHRKPADTQFICVDFVDKLPLGDSVLTVLPITNDNIMISYLLVP